ncbi:MAG TPA: ABC transporter permease [Gemmatimonadaceae bacterium]|nr:ABC transporter permease [Gemmatimonadaceae bacterium]
MNAPRVWFLRLTSIFGRARRERELSEEIESHVQIETDELINRGVAPAEARRMALAHGGGVSEVHDAYRDQRGIPAVEQLLQDIRYGARTLRRSPGFTMIIVVMLALGIGSNTAIFTLIDAVVMRQLPVPHPEQLIAIGDPSRVGGFSDGTPRTDLLSYPLYLALRQQSHAFSGILASGRSGRLDVHIGAADAPLEHPRGRFVSGNYFTLLGVPAFRGRVFGEAEDGAPGTSPVAVISYGYWTRRFHNDPAAIGKSIVVDDNGITIIGVAPEGYTGEIVGISTDIWLPITMNDALQPHQRTLTQWNASWLLLMGRAAPGVTLAQATQEIEPLITQLIIANAPGKLGKEFAADKRKYYVGAGDRGFSRVRATFETPLFTLLIGVALLLVIICANVANLLLARAVVRGKEMAVRLALGANRSRLVRQLLTESILLALAGSAAGLLVAWWGSRALITLAFDGTVVPLDLSLDLRVLAFTLAASFIAVVLFGLVPALRASRVELAATMRASAAAVSSGSIGNRGNRMALGKLLIAGQVALSVVLLVGAAMLVRSLRNVQSVDVGLDRDHLLIADVDITTHGYARERLLQLAQSINERVGAIPGVDAVTYSENGIFSGTESGTNLRVPGFIARAAEDTNAAYDVVGPGYARGIGARIVSGHDLTPADEGQRGNVALVNRSFATFYYPSGNAVGQVFTIDDTTLVEIVGVLADTRDHGLKGTPDRRIYFSYAQQNLRREGSGSLRFMIRAKGDPALLVNRVREAIVAIDPALPIGGIDPLTDLMQQSIREERLVAKLATGFGALALLLASVGLYGVMTYAITRRTREIGLRVALGARRIDLVRSIVLESLGLVAVGMVFGVPIALGAARLLRAQLTGIDAIDFPSIAGALTVLAVSAAGAAMLPALRASKVSPIVALQSD